MWDRGDAGERGHDVVYPGPRFRYFESSASCAVGQAGGDVEHPVAQRFRLSVGQDAVFQRQQFQPSTEVGGDHAHCQPCLVDGELTGGEPSQAGGLRVPDPVFDPGMSPMPDLQELELPSGGVGDEGLVSPPVDLFEQ